MKLDTIIFGDALVKLKKLPNESIDCCITSPPYWGLRDYGESKQIGLESHFNEYIEKLCIIFDEVKRVLKKEGTCWVNLGDTYSGNKEGKTDAKVSDYLKDNTKRLHKKAVIQEKCLCQIPSRFSLAMTDRDWILRNEIIWYKPNAMPSSVNDRFTVDFEKIFLFSKNKRYYFEQQFEQYALASDVRYRQALRAGKSYNSKEPYKKNTPYAGKFDIENAESFCSPRARYKRGTGSVASRGDDADGLVVGGTNPNGRNMRSVWTIPTYPYPEAHFATFPEKLIEPMVMAGCPREGVVLDPFMGAGTTAIVAKKLKRHFLGIELNRDYIKIAEKRIRNITLPLL